MVRTGQGQAAAVDVGSRGRGDRGRGSRGRGARSRWWRGGRRIVVGRPAYGYNNWWSYYYAAQQQQAYLQYLQQLAAAYQQPQYAAVPGAAMQVAQLRASIDRLTQELADIQNALNTARP